MIPGTLDLVIDRGTTFGPVTLVCYDDADAVVPLTGYSAFAQVRKKAGGTLVLDLGPTITNASAGEITIPQILDTATAALTQFGKFVWDLVLQDASGNRYGPFLAGKVEISKTITQRP